MNIVKNKKGFTLIELIVVIVIIGILSLVSVPVYRKYISEACMTEGYTLVGAVARAELVYSTTKGSGKFLKGFTGNGGTYYDGQNNNDGWSSWKKAKEIGINPQGRFFCNYYVTSVNSYDHNRCTDAILICACGYGDEDWCDSAYVWTTVYSDGHIADLEERYNGYN